MLSYVYYDILFLRVYVITVHRGFSKVVMALVARFRCGTGTIVNDTFAKIITFYF